MSPGRIEIDIDEVVLHGFGPVDREAVGLAMQAGLAALIEGSGLDDPPESGLELETVDGGRIVLAAGPDARGIGAGVAQATFRAANDALRERTAR